MLKGTLTALVTPFTERGELDLEGARRLVEHQLEAGIDGFVVLGTTGEAPALSDGERKTFLGAVKQMVGDRAILIAGTGTNNTSKTIAQTAEALEMGYGFALVVTPYYNKPTQDGLYLHYSLICSELPRARIIVYNVPGRTGVSIAPETVARLRADFPENIVAVKEASGSLDNASALVKSGITVLSGDDSLTVPMMAIGAKGVISVASNPAPKLVSDMVNAALSDDFKKASELHLRLWPLFKVLFIETSPGPVKALLGEMGLIKPHLRPPLAPVSQKTMDEIRGLKKELSL
ncbi:MAG: 4-hydroxy-tetrahydrodipicolinate synthase [candidate division WOR-3 bacterium]